MNSEDDFDSTEKADWWDERHCDCRFAGDEADASECDLHGLNALPFPDFGDIHAEPDPCPVRHRIFLAAQTVGEMMDALNCHKLEYCEACGQLEGFIRERRAA